MSDRNYMITVFKDGKCVDLQLVHNLDDLVTIKALYSDCEIGVFSLTDYSWLSQEMVGYQTWCSGKRWQEWRRGDKGEQAVPVKATPASGKAPKQIWSRPVMCVETGQMFGSVRECSNKVGIPYMTIMNCIKNGNATRGVHFVDLRRWPKEQEEEQ